ncbi:hypothetical protein QIH87_49820 (plasmid) [Bradyrhizobium elkanii]|uniref:hypothetical protein n=1 Tax=Bradyrhizobium elkanii TaxID=29448 RepID=UPI002714ACFF|nr:hypothetical protein [Bradyrhizobium elkanii]WLB14828.1 hypothetical protein QIH87_49820 [Bradyrhizobium elkanii]WLB69080.1 hypothetical protein QIH89_27585 [Bradyrhizobium elkanii]
MPLDAAKGRCRAIAIKSSWKLAPWSDALYGLDRGWWIANQGAPSFGGLKISPSPTACRVYGLLQVRLRPVAEILTGEIGIIGAGLRTGGGFSGFHAINLAIQFGARRILLVGFDMNLSAGAHWSKDCQGVGKPDKARTESWRASLDAIRPQFDRLGIQVINIGERSSLKSFKKMSQSEALDGSDDARRSA